jgi:hypothetical protein
VTHPRGARTAPESADGADFSFTSKVATVCLIPDSLIRFLSAMPAAFSVAAAMRGLTMSAGALKSARHACICVY